MKPNVFTVSQVNRYLKSLLEDDVILQDLFVEAEISNFTHHGSGHMYFTLKDGTSALNGVMFKGYAQELTFTPENGMKVIAYGRLSIYEKTGQFQLYVEVMQPAGVGALYVAFEQLKEKLLKEGLFDQGHKRAIPAYARCVAIVTSPTGAAVRDIIQIARRRNKGVSLVVVPSQVQGDDAPGAIAQAIKLVNKWGRADVIIVGRGGGSMEDLWAFNEEVVARAIFHSKIPVISAVGHETDFTIADFVADLRAPTPSAAAELAVFNHEAMAARFRALNAALHACMAERLENKYYIEQCIKKMHREMEQKLSHGKMLLAGKAALLHQLSPLTTISRGFTLVYDEAGRVQMDMQNMSVGDRLRVQFRDGSLISKVISR